MKKKKSKQNQFVIISYEYVTFNPLVPGPAYMRVALFEHITVLIISFILHLKHSSSSLLSRDLQNHFFLVPVPV